MQFTDPVKGIPLEFRMIPLELLEPSPYQRQPSTALVNKLVTSIHNGFLDPLLVVPFEQGFYYIDGQHRMAALRKVITPPCEVPCIVAPWEYIYLPLFWNIEKTDNIRDISSKIYNLYTDAAARQPNETESTVAAATTYEPSYITIAFAHIEHQTSSPSLTQTAVKKLDRIFFRDTPLSEAIEARRSMGQEVRLLEDTVLDVADRYYIKDYNLKMAILSKTTQKLWGPRKKPDLPFSEGIMALVEGVQKENWSWMAGR